MYLWRLTIFTDVTNADLSAKFRTGQSDLCYCQRDKDLCPCWPRQQDIFCRHNYITTVTMPRQLFGSLNDQQCTTVFVQRTRFPFEWSTRRIQIVMSYVCCVLIAAKRISLWGQWSPIVQYCNICGLFNIKKQQQLDLRRWLKFNWNYFEPNDRKEELR